MAVRSSSSRRLHSDIGPYAIIPRWLMERASPMALALYAHLADRAGRDQAIFPGRKWLAQRLHCSIKTVDRTMAELKQIDAVTVRRRYRKEGSQTTNEYFLRQRDPATPVTLPLPMDDAPPQVTSGEAPATPMSPLEPENRDPDLSLTRKKARRSPTAVAPDFLADLWNDRATGYFPKVKPVGEMSATRRRLAQRAWSEHPDPNWWRAALDLAYESRFLCGAKGWAMTFNWFLSKDNALQVSEGVHANETGDFPTAETEARQIVKATRGECSHAPMCADQEEHFDRLVDRILGIDTAPTS